MYSILRAKNEGFKQDMAGFAQELVRTPSPSLEEGKVALLVENKMKDLGYDKVVRDESGNVLGILFGREAEPTLLLNCHMDVVATGDDEQWGGNPYSGRMEGGVLYGRGAADCKSGITAQVYAGALLKRSMLPLRGNLVVAMTVAEENGRSLGVRGLVEHTLPDLEMKPTFAILGEPTNLGLYYGHDGWLELEVRVEGANPFHVDDAAKAIFSDLDRGYARRLTGDVEMVTIYEPSFEEISGARRATIRMNRRLRHAEDVGEVMGEVKHNASLAAKMAGTVAVDVAVRQENQRLYTGRTSLVKHVTHAWTTDPFCPLMERARQSLAAASCTVRPGRWQLGRLGMGTAGSVLLNEFKVPTVGYGPGDEKQAHAVNESVEVARIAEAAYGTAAIAHGLVGIPVCGWTSDEI